ncbi:ImmA/IrrE family metallo-endopeptidase [Roseateles saccharophilus]|uniref:Helix-turn-helix protein n=2 Tax=Roseateles saccharophilus TaxID=304 RepID=A0A4R3UC19_ROSSA|nr:ImmA/IrrE family metallo-endopeptidase [Roseateles saccharophilus]TCU84478.1 helix-turn-helix protein [Roseateles saccharophilus]
MFDRTADAARPEAARHMSAMGGRVRVARESAKITQADLCEAVGFADRQTLSAIENGERRIQAAELVRISQAVNRPIEWFIDPFVVEGDARFSWRVAKSLPDEALTDFESRIGRLVGLLRHLKMALQGNSSVFSPVLRVSRQSTFEEAWVWGELVAQHLDLGIVPAVKLVEAIETRLDIPVLYVDAHVESEARGISGAMCRLPDLQVIVINRHESPARRNFDVAHELFHALTWDALPPQHREDPDNVAKGTLIKRIEHLADNFAAALLMPRASLDKLIPEEKLGDAEYLVDVARELHVSTGALAFRLLNLKLIGPGTCEAVRKLQVAKEQSPAPELYSESFVNLLHEGILRGHVSARKGASALAMTLEQLSGLMSKYGKSAPFVI